MAYTIYDRVTVMQPLATFHVSGSIVFNDIATAAFAAKGCTRVLILRDAIAGMVAFTAADINDVRGYDLKALTPTKQQIVAKDFIALIGIREMRRVSLNWDDGPGAILTGYLG